MVDQPQPLFKSFWQAGYEGADHVNGQALPLDMNRINQHSGLIIDDYLRLADLNIRTLRESAGWRLTERHGRFDFSPLELRARAARELDLQIIWTFLHYGWPEDVDVFSADLSERFAEYCAAAARYLKGFSDAPLICNPINEISFLTFAICETNLIHPYRGELAARGYELKRNLVRAAIAGCDAIRSVDAGARFLHTDPLIHIVPATPDDLAAAEDYRGYQFQAWDMLGGRVDAELGGGPQYLDLIGVNYYHSNQWEVPGDARLHWHLGDARRRPFRDMLIETWQRYKRPMVIAETSHIGVGRGQWIREIGQEATAAREAGVRLDGICLYPIIDRPDWENLDHWHNSGLWDVTVTEDGLLERQLCEHYAADLAAARKLLDPAAPLPSGNDSTRAHASLKDTDTRDPGDGWQTNASLCANHAAVANAPGFADQPLFMNEHAMPNLIVFSHLRWDFVYQRPQHLMTRLAQHYRVFFIEEPVFDTGPAAFHVREAARNVCVATPHTPVRAAGFHDEQLPGLQKLLAQFVDEQQLDDYSVWFYTPMALPLLALLKPRAVVYDCMDELQAFKNAPRQLVQRETALLKMANVVFTGGRSLYAAKRERHPHVHCFPSSVDAAHFRQALDFRNNLDDADHPLQQKLAKPRLGFFGVIDERLDLALVESLADARPDWQLVFVGPVVKIDQSMLPRRPNIHYLGQQDYQSLPRFLAGWDVCLMPFALNESTRFISPTKTLEYMAAERPIVSTPIADVAALYADVVYVAAGLEAFVAACTEALTASATTREARTARMREVVASTSWDQTALAMRNLIDTAGRDGLTDGARSVIRREPFATSRDADERTPIPSGAGPNRAGAYDYIILGAGPTGLSAAYHLSESTLLVEKNPTVGGWCRSIEEGGFTFDYAGHIMFSNDEYVHGMYKTLLGDNVHWQDREAWVYSKNVYTRYPFQGALYGLPPKVLQECLIGAIEARFGRLDGGTAPAAKPVPPAKAEASPAKADAQQQTGAPDDCCADGVSACVATVANVKTENAAGSTGAAGKPGPRNFEEFIYQIWGAGVAKHFAIPYNKKLWAVPLSEMETSWLGGRVPLPNLEEMIAGALEPVSKPVGPNARFGYPLRGGFQALMNGFLPHLRGELKLNAEIVAVSPGRRTVTLKDGNVYAYKTLISTLPLPQLVKMSGDEAPAEIRRAVQGLRHVSVRCVNLGIGRERITEKHWIYYPEDSVFHRIFVQGNASPHCNPPGGFGITCEITYSEHKPLPCDGEALIARCIDDCIKVGMIRAADPVLVANQVDMPYAYVVYDHARADNVRRIKNWLAAFGIIASGRYGEWEYYNSDHAFIAGKKAAEKASGKSDASNEEGEAVGRAVDKTVQRRLPVQAGGAKTA